MAFKRKHARNSRNRRRSPVPGGVTLPPVFTTSASIQHDGSPAVGEQLIGVDGVATGGTIVSRRWLLGSTVLATVGAFTPGEAGVYRYEVRAEGSGGSATSGAAVTVAAAATPPGARFMQSGANAGGVTYYMGEALFIDRMRMADRFAGYYASGGQRVFLEDVAGVTYDSAGWPSALPPTLDGRLSVIFKANRLVEGANVRYHVEVDNAPTAGVTSTQTIVSRTATTLLVQNTAPGNGGFVQLDFPSFNPGFRLRIVREDQKALLDPSKPDKLNPEALARWAPHTLVRAMDWSHTNNSTLAEWVDRPKVSDPTYQPKGMPLETMVAFANATGCDLHYCFPALATDDFVTQATTYFRDNLAGRLFTELSNEVWNYWFRAFDQYDAYIDGLLGPDVWNGLEYHGYRAAQVAAITSGIYSAAGKRMRLLNGFGCQFTDGVNFVNNISGASDARMKYATWGGGKPSGSNVDMPATGFNTRGEAFDIYYVAPYSGGMLTLPNNYKHVAQKNYILRLVRMADQEASMIEALRQWEYGDQAVGFVGGPSSGRPPALGDDETFPGIMAILAGWRKKCDADGVRLGSYEGQLIPQVFGERRDEANQVTATGWTPAEIAEISPWIARLLARPELEGMMERYYRQMAAAGLESMNIFMHCDWHADGGNGSLAGAFGNLRYETEPAATAPRYRGVLKIAANPAVLGLNVKPLVLTANTFPAAVGDRPRRVFTLTGGRAPRALRTVGALPAARTIALFSEVGEYTQAGAGQQYAAHFLDSEGMQSPDLVVNQAVTPAVVGTRYRFVRFVVEKVGRQEGDNGQRPDPGFYLGEFGLLNGSGLSLPLQSTAPIESTVSVFGGYAVANVIDGDPASALVTRPPIAGTSITFDLVDNPVRPASAFLTPWNTNGFGEEPEQNCPSQFRVLLSNDKSSWVTFLDTVDGFLAPAGTNSYNRRGYARGVRKVFPGTYPNGA